MRKHFFLIALALCVQVWAATVTAPANLPQYYSTYINNKSASTLFTGVHDVVGVGFSSISYSAVWDAYEVTDTKSNGTSIYDFYSYCSDFTYPNSQEGKSGANSKEGDCYNREHSIPKSWFGGSTSTGTPGTDLFHLVPADKIINSLRSAHAYGEVTAANATSTSKTGCGNNANPLHNYCRYGTASAITISNTIISSGSTTQSPTVTVFEPLQEYKGDLARGYFGTLLKWAGDYDAFTTGDGAQMFSGDYTAAGNFGLTPYGIALLLKWHREDPVSQKEIDRNNGVQQKQGNRNPFIDYPILAEYIWGKYAGETFSQENAVGSFESGFTPGVSDGDKNGSTPATYTVTWFVEGTQYAQQSTLPADPNDCSASRVFVGWTTNSSVNGPAPEDLFTTTPLAITANTTFYAVFADKQTTSLPITVTDSLTRAFTGVTGTSYTTWADKAGTSGVVYAGNSAGGNSAIQMRSDQSSAGIITTTSPGTIKNVTLVWNSNTNNTRVVNVYGKNTPYSSAADLYSTETQGTLLGSMKMSTDKTSLDISATYAYVGIRSNSGALYLDSVLFTWNVPGGATETTYINYSPRCNEEYDFRALAATEVTHNSFMANWTEAAGDSYTLDVTKDVKKQQETAVFDKDFTASLDGWTINNVSGYDNVWTHSTSYGAKATSYVNSTQNAAESWLLSSNIDLTNVVNPVLTLNHLFRYGTSVYLKIKEQSSESWDELSPTNWAAGSDWTFVNSVADLSSYAGKIIQIGFKYVGTSSACPTWEIKQITITGTTEVNDLESIDGYPRKVYDTSALVSGLDAKTTYYYTVTPENGIVSNRIEVTTLENEEPTNMENVFPAPDVRKLLINGQIFILREGFLYTLTGQRIR